MSPQLVSVVGAPPKIVRRPHPRGEAGIRTSLDEVVKRVREGRLEPKIRQWATGILFRKGKPRNPREQAQAILDGLREQTMYVPDPVDAEFIAGAKVTLCLEKDGYCIVGGDCDDLVVTYGSGVMSIGIPMAVIGQSFRPDGEIGHVLGAIWDGLHWWRVDPSEDLPVGKFHAPTRELWIDPMTGGVLCDGKPTCIPSGVAGTGGAFRSYGDFVGVGKANSSGSLGQVNSSGSLGQVIVASGLWGLILIAGTFAVGFWLGRNTR